MESLSLFSELPDWLTFVIPIGIFVLGAYLIVRDRD